MEEDIKACVEVLRKGGVILYPTDTVWGLGCDATSEQAVERIFRIKKRSSAKSLVLLACDMDMGILSVRVDETFMLPGGKEKSWHYAKTAIVE